jgi:hypothetical protein
MNLHGGNGIEVSFIDYMEGRLTGIYKQNYPSQQQQLSLKYRTYFDTFYGTTRSLNNASSFFSSPYSNPFIMPYTRSEVYHRHPSVRSNNSYSDLPYRGMKPSSSSASATPAPPQDLLSQMTTEYCREFARELARKAVSVATTTATTPQPNMQSSPIQGGIGYNPILGVQHKQQQQQQEDVFGYRFEICNDCLYTEPLKVSFGKDGTKDNTNNSSNSNSNNNNDSVEVVPRKEQKHVCNPKVVASNRKEVQDIEGSVKTMVDNLPKIASRMTKWWTNGQNKRISLIAVKIPHKNKNNDHEDNYNNIAGNAAADNNDYDDDNDNNIQPQQETIIIPNPKNPKQQITFQCSQEKHINLSLISNETSKNHYAARAIKYGHTILTDEEMEDFLNMVQTSTFAIFKIHKSSPTTATASSSLQPSQQQHHHKQQDESIGLYFMAIIPYDDTLYLQSWLPNVSNDSKDNNNNNNISVQSDSANETFLSLCNHLTNISNFTIPMNSQPSSSRL